MGFANASMFFFYIFPAFRLVPARALRCIQKAPLAKRTWTSGNIRAWPVAQQTWLSGVREMVWFGLVLDKALSALAGHYRAMG